MIIFIDDCVNYHRVKLSCFNTYIDDVRQKEHIELTDAEYNKYKKFVEKVFEE